MPRARYGGVVQPVPPPGSAAWRLALPSTCGMPRVGTYPTCPLCGNGEAGGEHLALHCTSVQQAWYDLTARSDTLVLALLQPVAPHLIAIKLLHQVSYLHCSLRNAPSLSHT